MAFDDDFLNIDTPENVAFGYEIVGIGSRFLAALLDTLIILVLQGVSLGVVAVILGVITNGDTSTSWVLAIFSLVSFLLLWGYYIFFEMLWNGQTPGKRTVGLRVIRADGTPITLSESIIRNLVRLVDFMPFLYTIGVIAMFIDGRSRRLGDMAGGTVVVRDSSDVSLADVTRKSTTRTLLPSSQNIQILVQNWPIHVLEDSDIEIAERLLQRVDKIQGGRQLAYNMATKLMGKMEVSDSIQYTDGLYVLNELVKNHYKYDDF